MALTYGFYNSLNGDRKYSAKQFGAIFDGIIRDGVYSSIGGRMVVNASGTGFQVNIQTGRAWFNHTWTLNDTVYALTLPNPEPLLNKYVAVVLEVNEEQGQRRNSFKYVAGTPASSPSYPTLTNTSTIHQYPLAYCLVKAGATKITQSEIRNMVGTSSCPYVTGVITSFNIDELIAQWQSQWNDQLNAKNTQWNNMISADTTQWNAMIAANTNEFNSMMSSDRSTFESFMNSSTSAFDAFMARSETSFEDFLTAEDAEFDESMLKMKADFNSFWTDFKAGMVEYLQEQEDIWENWFQRIQGQLSEDAATNLQRQIDALCFVYIMKNRAILGIAASIIHRKAVFGTYGSVAGNKLMITAPTIETVGVNGRRAMLATSGTVVDNELDFNPNSSQEDNQVTVHGEPINN